jgi:hypothetical protein
MEALLGHSRDVGASGINIGGYERAGLISDGEALEMRDLARNLREAVREWLKSKHPSLLPRGGKQPQNR